MIGIVLILLFAAAQGAAVFATAYLGLRLLKKSHWLAKGAAMAASYAGWSSLTLIGYALMSGDGGLMDGFGLVLVLCLTALVSSIVYAVVWAMLPRRTAAD